MDLFAGSSGIHCAKAADGNDDGKVDISDAVFLLGFLFLGGEAPKAPWPGCGADPTADDLTCGSFRNCP
jgi:hypothetical protein